MALASGWEFSASSSRESPRLPAWYLSAPLFPFPLTARRSSKMVSYIAQSLHSGQCGHTMMVNGKVSGTYCSLLCPWQTQWLHLQRRRPPVHSPWPLQQQQGIATGQENINMKC